MNVITSEVATLHAQDRVVTYLDKGTTLTQNIVSDRPSDDTHTPGKAFVIKL